MLGYSRDELLKRTIFDTYPSSETEAGHKRMAAIAADGSAYFERAMRRRDGVEILVSVSAIMLADGRLQAILQDITERKQAEEALRESEARFRAIASYTPDHILMQDRNLRYRLVINPQLGLTEKEMIGKTDRDFRAAEDAEKLTAIKTKFSKRASLSISKRRSAI